MSSTLAFSAILARCLVGWEAVSKTVAGDEPVARSNRVLAAKFLHGAMV